VPFLHRGARASDPDDWQPEPITNIAFDHHFAPTDGGLMFGSPRRLENGRTQWSVVQWLMPWYKIIPPLADDAPIGAHAWVPIDDENCVVWSFEFHPHRDLAEAEMVRSTTWRFIHLENIPGTDQRGGAPHGLDPASQRVRSASLVLPSDAPFEDLAPATLGIS
jgi:phthalate 4,5-dioxygenase oxygenase subunit